MVIACTCSQLSRRIKEFKSLIVRRYIIVRGAAQIGELRHATSNRLSTEDVAKPCNHTGNVRLQEHTVIDIRVGLHLTKVQLKLSVLPDGMCLINLAGIAASLFSCIFFHRAFTRDTSCHCPVLVDLCRRVYTETNLIARLLRPIIMRSFE